MNNYVSLSEIPFKLNNISEGDIVFVASDVAKLLYACRANKDQTNFNMFIDSLQKTVGEDGTIIFPTYNWDFCHGATFDILNTPSQVGSLTNIALKRKDFRRTAHPIYSFAVWGKRAEELLSMNNTDSFAENSPFAFLQYNDAKYMSVGLNPSYALTYVHYVEQLAQVDYRYLKNFTGNYIDIKGNQSIRTYSMFVRDLKINPQVINHSIALDVEFEKANAVTSQTINDVNFSIIELSKAHDIIYDEIVNNASKNIVSRDD